jgi:hypothetical protein
MKRYYLAWKEHGVRQSIVSPHVETPGVALHWLLQLKPYLIQQLRNITIKAWQRTDEQ